jgi:hypothetical protein
MRNFVRPSAVILAVIGILGRLLPHPANFTPIGGTAVFSGSKLPRPLNYALPIGVMFITDIFLGFHKTMIFVYGCFVLNVFLSELMLRKKATVGRLALVSTINSTIFFLVTNFGVWLETTLYPKTFSGLMASYTMGLPFWRNMFVADLLFGVGFVTLYQYFAAKEAVFQMDKRLVKSFKL